MLFIDIGGAPSAARSGPGHARRVANGRFKERESRRAYNTMNSVGRTAAILIVALLSAACPIEEGVYQPLAEGEEVRILLRGYRRPFVRDGAEYRGDAEAFLLSDGHEVGRRSTHDFAFRADRFYMNDGLEEKGLVCYLWPERSTNDFHASVCRADFKQAEPGRTIRVSFNDFGGSKVVMPELAELLSPEADSELSLGSGGGLVLSWTPPSQGEAASMSWSLQPLRDDEPGSCKNETSWDGSSGTMEDTGSFTIPKDELPADLPAEGCRVSLEISRGRDGTLDPGIKLGRIAGEQHDSVRMTLKP
jgi:hypothetical protein